MTDVVSLTHSMIVSVINGDISQAITHARNLFLHHPSLTLQNVQQSLREQFPRDPAALMLITTIDQQRPRLQFWRKSSSAREAILLASLKIVHERLRHDSVLREIKCEINPEENDFVLVTYGAKPSGSILSGDALSNVSSFLSPRDMLSASQVCRFWRNVHEEVIRMWIRAAMITTRRPRSPTSLDEKIVSCIPSTDWVKAAALKAAQVAVVGTGIATQAYWSVVAFPFCLSMFDAETPDALLLFFAPALVAGGCTYILDEKRKAYVGRKIPRVERNVPKIETTKMCNFDETVDPTDSHRRGWETVLWNPEFDRFVGHCCTCDQDFVVEGKMRFQFCHLCGCMRCCERKTK